MNGIGVLSLFLLLGAGVAILSLWLRPDEYFLSGPPDPEIETVPPLALALLRGGITGYLATARFAEDFPRSWSGNPRLKPPLRAPIGMGEEAEGWGSPARQELALEGPDFAAAMEFLEKNRFINHNLKGLWIHRRNLFFIAGIGPGTLRGRDFFHRIRHRFQWAFEEVERGRNPRIDTLILHGLFGEKIELGLGRIVTLGGGVLLGSERISRPSGCGGCGDGTLTNGGCGG